MISNIRAMVDELPVSKTIAPGDFMFAGQNEDHYFSVGRSALRSILACLTARAEFPKATSEITQVLDFGCGYGRVCRFLRAAFPEADISIADVNAAAVQFCIEQFGCTDVGIVPPADSFDLIWVGSVMTHLSEPAAKDLLYHLVQALRPNGVLVFTTHGRYSHAIHYCNPQKEMYLGGRIPNDRIAADFLATGFGYAEHLGQDEFLSLINPGVSIIDPRWVQTCLFACTGVMQIHFQERGWDFHQDVYGYTRFELLQAP